MTPFDPLFKDILIEGEEVRWAGKPDRRAFILPPIGLLGFGLLWLCFDGFFITMLLAKGGMKDGPGLFFIVPFFLFHMIPVWILLAWPLYHWLSWGNTVYAVTDKRFILRGGIIGVDFESVEFDQVQGVDVDVDLAGKLFGVGTVQLRQGISNRGAATGKTFWDIEKPYEVAKLAKQVSMDVKTDENYPNALRPDSNPGYKTKYEPK